MPPIFPKLWRRLDNYTKNNEFENDSSSLERFKEFLEQTNDRCFVISLAHKVSFKHLIEVRGETLYMNKMPEDLIFDH